MGENAQDFSGVLDDRNGFHDAAAECTCSRIDTESAFQQLSPQKPIFGDPFQRVLFGPFSVGFEYDLGAPAVVVSKRSAERGRNTMDTFRPLERRA